MKPTGDSRKWEAKLCVFNGNDGHHDFDMHVPMALEPSLFEACIAQQGQASSGGMHARRAEDTEATARIQMGHSTCIRLWCRAYGLMTAGLVLRAN